MALQTFKSQLSLPRFRTTSPRGDVGRLTTPAAAGGEMERLCVWSRVTQLRVAQLGFEPRAARGSSSVFFPQSSPPRPHPPPLTPPPAPRPQEGRPHPEGGRGEVLQTLGLPALYLVAASTLSLLPLTASGVPCELRQGHTTLGRRVKAPKAQRS